ncbi:response regulator [Hyphomicrobium sp.]|uniref:response regulator n=1 Tax=Hyphomicrobium sp. TaxID=82 RepID=UPI0025C02BBD|nr:response regulator [Hyphomicrobium sp.]MCC7251359.1 response regulator [Hyphomicrobium sp.]
MTTLTGLSVLLVEDEYLIALDAEQILKDLGVEEVEVIASWDAAEKRAKDGQFDLAVLDVNINGKFSFPIANIIRDRGIPFVFASGYELRNRSPSDLGGAVCVTKPYTSDRLKDALTAVLTKGTP